MNTIHDIRRGFLILLQSNILLIELFMAQGINISPAMFDRVTKQLKEMELFADTLFPEK